MNNAIISLSQGFDPKAFSSVFGMEDDFRLILTVKGSDWSEISSLKADLHKNPNTHLYLFYSFYEKPEVRGINSIKINNEKFFVFFGDGPEIWDGPERRNNPFNLMKNVFRQVQSKDDLLSIISYYSKYYPILFVDEKGTKHFYGKWYSSEDGKIKFSFNPNLIKKKQVSPQKGQENQRKKKEAKRKQPSHTSNSVNSIFRAGLEIEKASIAYTQFLTAAELKDKIVVHKAVDLNWGKLLPGDLILYINDKSVNYSDLLLFDRNILKEFSKNDAVLTVMRYDNSDLKTCFKKITITKDL